MAPKENLGSNGKPVQALVLDDDPDFADDCAKQLTEGAAKAGVEVSAVPADGETLGNVVKELYQRSSDFRDAKGHCEEPADLDQWDLLVIDSDLRGDPQAGLVSGTDLAYSARCFTDVGCIAVLNAFGENPFDLTMLGHRRSFADVHLGSEQLANPGLWKLDTESEFRPWHWPLLHLQSIRLRERAAWLRDGRLDEPIAKLFCLEDPELEAMPRSMASFLTAARDRKAAPTKDLPEINPVEFLLSSEYGLLRRDAEVVADAENNQRAVLARTAAARLTRWLSLLVAGQDILVDAPHLASRFPSTVEGKDPDDFERTIRLEVGGKPAEVLKRLGLSTTDGPLQEHRFSIGPWTDRPLWWGQRLGRSELLEAQRPWEFESPGVVFCEDASRFVSEEKAWRFACDLDTPYRIRYLARLDGDVTYRPRENLVLD
jgi:hypothetical protein